MASTTGLISRHIDQVKTDELIEVANGIKTIFNYQTIDFPLKLDQDITVDFVVGSVSKSVTFQGSSYSDADISSLTIDEAGVLSITFVVAPDNATNVEISYETKGLLTVLVDFVAPVKKTDTVIGTGNGVQTTFDTSGLSGGKLAGTNLSKGNVRAEFFIQGVRYFAYDNALGEFNSVLISSSSIDYNTLVVSLTTTEAVDSSTDVIISYLDTNVDGQDWYELIPPRDITDPNNNNQPYLDADGRKEVILRNSGISGQEEIIVLLRSYERSTQDYYGLEVDFGMRWTPDDDEFSGFYNSNVLPGLSTYDTTNRKNNGTSYIATSNDGIKYWIFSNKNRIILESRNAGTNYTSFYVGHGLRLSTQKEYPNPSVCIASGVGIRSFSDIAVTSLRDPADFKMIDEQGIYLRESTSSSNFRGFSCSNWDDVNIVKTDQLGRVTTYPIFCYSHGANIIRDLRRLYFSLDGVYHTPNNEIDAEDTLGTEYIVFQDVYRTFYFDYFAIKDE